MKHLLISVITATLLLSGCSLIPSENIEFALADIPYTWKISKDLASHLTVETPNNEYSSQAKEFGAQAQAIVYYKPTNGDRVNFMGVFYFPANSYLAVTRADEPPPFGSKVVESNGMILSTWGPQDSIYEPETQDGKNISKLYKYVYAASSFTPTNAWNTKAISSIVGCYGATLKADRFYLEVTKQEGLKIEAKISIYNSQKDSSYGNFAGTFDGTILIGLYSFVSEGMNSRRELMYRLTPRGFLSGYGPVEEVGDTARFIRPLTISWDESYIYSAQKFCE